MNTAIHARRMRRVLWTCAGRILVSLRVFRRGASLLLVAAPATMAGYLALATRSGILPVLQVWLVKLVVDALTDPAGHPQHATGHVLVLAALYALTFVGLTVLDPSCSCWHACSRCSPWRWLLRVCRTCGRSGAPQDSSCRRWRTSRAPRARWTTVRGS